jgi:hypothetical protein
MLIMAPLRLRTALTLLAAVSLWGCSDDTETTFYLSFPKSESAETAST